MKNLQKTIFFLVSIICFNFIIVSAQNFKCGDKITLTHVATGAHLHSHAINYSHPRSSRQQQITGYQGLDNNDIWVIQDCERNQVRDGSQIRLQHLATGSYLHSHANIPPPITQSQQEVSGWIGKDENDLWTIQVEGGGNWSVGKTVRLVHTATNSALHSHNVMGGTLPVQQQEVTAYNGRDNNDFWTAAFADGNSESPGKFPIEKTYQGIIQRSDISSRVSISNNGKFDYFMTIKNRDQYIGSCAVFYIVLADRQGNIMKTFGGDQFCVDGRLTGNGRASREDRLSYNINRNELSSLRTVEVIFTPGGKISLDLFRGNLQKVNEILNSCPECIKIPTEVAVSY